MRTSSVAEGVRIAVVSLRSHKLRAALTVLGVVIGVATVMLIAALVGGVRSTVIDLLGSAGKNSFAVWRFDPDQIRLMGTWEEMWAGNPRLTLEDAERVAALPSIGSVSPIVYNDQAVVSLGAEKLGNVMLQGQSTGWPGFTRGDFVQGRNFLPAEVSRSSQVVVLSSTTARALGGGKGMVGRAVRISGEELRVIGVFREDLGLLGGDDAYSAWVPVSTAMKRLDVRRDFLRIQVVPARGVSQARAMDDVVVALRTRHGLRAAAPNDFILKTNQEMVEMSARWADAFFMVAMVLSSIGLLVGGVGVVGIMMISVTERTREIGVRKALGATHHEILWQFLVEAVTVTVIGGMLGVLVGSGGAMLVSAVTPVPAAVPLWSIVAALLMSAACGVGFGLYPARQAARLNPVDALRYE